MSSTCVAVPRGMRAGPGLTLGLTLALAISPIACGGVEAEQPEGTRTTSGLFSGDPIDEPGSLPLPTPLQLPSLPGQLVLPHAYVIITTNAIVNSSSRLADFVNSKRNAFKVWVVTENSTRVNGKAVLVEGWGGGTGQAAARNIRA